MEPPPVAAPAAPQTPTPCHFRIAKKEEKPGWVWWFVSKTYYFVSTVVRTVTFKFKKPYIQEVFSDCKNRSFTRCPIFGANLIFLGDQATAMALFEHHRNENLFTIDGKMKSSLYLLTKLLFSRLNFKENDMILTCDQAHSTTYRSFLNYQLTRLQISKRHEEITRLIETDLANWSLQPEVDLSIVTKRMTAKIIGEIFLGYPGPYDAVADAIGQAIIPLLARISWEDPVKLTPTEQAGLDAFVDIVERVVAHKSEAGKEDTLIESMKKQNFSEAQINAMVFTLIFASTDNTSNVASYILIKLAQNPTYQSEVLNKKLPIEWLIAEGLRMFTPVSVLSRTARHDEILETKPPEFISAGSIVVYAPTFAARNPSVVNDSNLNEFYPYRWKDKEVPTYLPDLPWKPFGGAVHECVGSKFAESILKIIIESACKHFTLTTPIKGEPRQKTTFTNRLDGAVPLKLTSRSVKDEQAEKDKHI